MQLLSFRFDSDFREVEEQLQEAKSSRDKAEKERDEHYMNISKKIGEMQVLKTENSELRTMVSRLRREAEELLENAVGTDLSELTALQKTRKELENKIREQEDEMDDLAGQNQLLQQTVTRLEMGAERLKTDLAREAVIRETEIDELRGQYQRRRDEIDRLEGQKKYLTAELKLANRRIEALQSALSDGLDNDDSDNDAEKIKDNGSAELAAQKALFTNNTHKTISDFTHFPPPPELPAGGLPKNVESMIIGMGVVDFVTGALILPTGITLVTDESQGVLLFDIKGNLIRKVQ
uniref:NUDE_C domain-containing protein n=1 Tax=Heterorhabditis bacteriophora TaxID=37862 RepID=A0A1I7XRQ2_HETBA